MRPARLVQQRRELVAEVRVAGGAGEGEGGRPRGCRYLEMKSRYMRPQKALNQTQLSTSVTSAGRYRLLGSRPAEEAVA